MIWLTIRKWKTRARDNHEMESVIRKYQHESIISSWFNSNNASPVISDVMIHFKCFFFWILNSIHHIFMFQSYRNHSIDLLCISVQFLFDDIIDSKVVRRSKLESVLSLSFFSLACQLWKISAKQRYALDIGNSWFE